MYERIFYLLLVETRDVFYVQMMFEEENAEHLQISLILHFSTSPILQLRLLKLCKALAHPYFYQIDISFHLIPSQSQEWSHPNSPRLQKLCTLLRGGGAGILKFCAPLLYPRIMTQASLSWTVVLPVSGMTVVICHWLWTPTQANFNKHNSFTETCKQPRHWSSQMESCLYHTL